MTQIISMRQINLSQEAAHVAALREFIWIAANALLLALILWSLHTLTTKRNMITIKRNNCRCRKENSDGVYQDYKLDVPSEPPCTDNSRVTVTYHNDIDAVVVKVLDKCKVIEVITFIDCGLMNEIHRVVKEMYKAI